MKNGVKIGRQKKRKERKIDGRKKKEWEMVPRTK